MELRKDYILDRWVIISENRSKRPHQFEKVKTDKVKLDNKPKTEDKCFFCPGNEETTPEEVGRIEENNKWKMRWFKNKFPITNRKGNPKIHTDNKFYTVGSAYGDHLIIVETPDHDKQLIDLSKKDLVQLMKVYSTIIDNFGSQADIKYVNVFKNKGKDAGTSIIHSHSQAISLNKLPSTIEEKISAIKKFTHCPYCEIIESEKKSDRRCFENNNFIAFTPYASRFKYEIWLLPKTHHHNIRDFSQDELRDLAEILKKILIKLNTLNASYNFVIVYSPEGEDLHFHIEILPRIGNWAGYELGSNIIANTVSPENAASFYRE